jgi:enoyl-[acyl-carrier protein] reductase I
MGLLDGKKGLIYGVRNERSIGWGCAKSLAREGATFALTYFGEREGRDVNKLAPTLGEGVVPFTEPCNLLEPEQVQALHERVAREMGGLDFVIHSVAFAKGLSGRHVDNTLEEYQISVNSSAFTFVAAAKAAEPLMTNGGALVTISFLGGDRVVPNYNTAGIAKAALESSVKYLANDLGPQNIRVNAVSAGPVQTLSARGIQGFGDMYKVHRDVSPLRHNTTPDEVGDACAFLCSHLSRGVTGEVLFVDSGYHVLGFPTLGLAPAAAQQTPPGAPQDAPAATAAENR